MKPIMLATDAASFLGVTVQAIHKQLKSRNFPFEKRQNRVFFSHETAKKIFKLNFNHKTIAIQIVKGGTGKTSLAHSIAVRANLYGAKVLCIDLDQQGNLTQAFQINPDKTPIMIDIFAESRPIKECILPVIEGLDLLPSRIENATLDSTLMLKRLPLDRAYKDKLKSLKTIYDLIIIDCPPALGQSVTAATLAADLVIAPVTPEKFSLSGLKVTGQEISLIESTYAVNIPLKVLLNKFDSRTVLSHETLSSLVKHPIYGPKMFKSYVRTSQEFPNVIAKGISLFDSIQSTPSKEDIDLLTQEVLEIAGYQPQQTPVTLGSLEEEKQINEVAHAED